MTHSHHHHPHDPEAARLPLWRLLFRVALAVIIVGLLVAYSMCFQVSEGYKAVVTRFDEPVRSITEAGLFWKWPWPIEEARQIDVRRRIHNTPYTATFTRDRISVVLLTYVVWHVDDPLLFLQSVGNRKDAEQKLNGIVVHYKHEHMGRHVLSDLVSVDPEQIKTEEIEKAMLADVAKEAREKFGIEVDQVGIKRIAYPEENITAVLAQMRQERRTEADKIRSEGEQKAQEIISETEVLKAGILRDGSEKAGKLRGDAQLAAAQIYREATLDQRFYEFWRKLEAIKRIVSDKTTLILRTDQMSVFDVFRAPPEPPSMPPAPGPAATAASTSATPSETSSPNAAEETR